MLEKQGIFNFEKQEAGRDIYNIAIQHLATGKRANLISIQYALRKGITTKGDFFKKEPEWIDFEQGFIVERKEVKEIADKLDIDKVHLVLGKPASGKSIILKNVGFKLADENKKIYIVELKKHQLEDVRLYFEAIPEINGDNPIFIVDDAHLYPSECERLIRDFKSGGKGTLIIGSRPTEDILPIHPKRTSEFQYLNKTEIQAEDVKDDMIRTFLKRKHNFSDNRMNKVSNNLEKYKNDLWQLSWALNAYKPEKDTVDDEEIYENIMISISEIETKDKKTINAEDVFLPLSVFYRYEIPIDRKFLEKQMDIKKDIIDDLVRLSEIVETEKIGKPTMLSLHHSSLAKLYLDVYQRYPSFGEEIREKILNGRDEKYLEYCSFYRYITTVDPKIAIDILASLVKDSMIKDLMQEKGGLTLIKKLIYEDKIQKSIEKGIGKAEDVENIGCCVAIIAQENKEAGLKLANSIDIHALVSKINKEEDISKSGWCVAGIAWGNKEVGLKLVDNIDIDALSLKINKEDDIEEIKWCVYYIAEASIEAGLRLVDNIDIDALLSKINKEKDIGKIKFCVQTIAEVSIAVATIITNRLNPKLREEMQKDVLDLSKATYH